MRGGALAEAAALEAGRGGEEEVGELARGPRHVDEDVGELLDEDGERAEVVVVGVRDEGVVDVPIGPLVDETEGGEAVGAVFLGVHAGVEDEAGLAELEEVAARPRSRPSCLVLQKS